MARREKSGLQFSQIMAIVALVVLIKVGEFVYENWQVLLVLAVLGLGLWIAFARARSKQVQERLLGLTPEDLDLLNGKDFEVWVGSVLEAAGWSCSFPGQGGGDFGADVLAEKEGVRVAIQAKRWKKKVGNRAVQEALAGAQYYRCSAAAVVTQSSFTKAAVEQAGSAYMPVLLIDRSSLSDMAALLSKLT